MNLLTDQEHPTRAVLRNRDVRLFLLSRLCSGTALTLLRATVAWQVFDATRSAFHLGLIGLVQFLPVLPMSLWAGAVADSFDRKRIVMFAQAAAALCSVVLLLTHQWLPTQPVSVIYLAVLALSFAASFENPARSSLLPTLVPREQFPSAVTAHATFQNLAWMSGPVLSGFVIDAAGVRGAFVTHLSLMTLSLVLFACVRRPAVTGDRKRVSWEAITEGVRFVFSRQVLLGSMLLDMLAVVFASATALLPIYANEILHVGPRGYGLLSGALEAGTFLMALVLMLRPSIVQPGRALLVAVAIYGVATVMFGFSRSLPLSILAFAIAGMADQVSMVTRATITQLSTPDELRGRVSSVSQIFIGASNQIGSARAGFVAAATNPTFAVISGGVACLVVLAVIAKKLPELRHYRPSPG